MARAPGGGRWLLTGGNAMAKPKRPLDPDMVPRSVRDVTSFLRQHGIEGVRLERGRGYFYFVGAPVLSWLNRTVVTLDLTSRTLAQWLEEYRRMVKQNGSADPFVAPTSRARQRRKSVRR